MGLQRSDCLMIAGSSSTAYTGFGDRAGMAGPDQVNILNLPLPDFDSMSGEHSTAHHNHADLLPSLVYPSTHLSTKNTNQPTNQPTNHSHFASLRHIQGSRHNTRIPLASDYLTNAPPVATCDSCMFWVLPQAVQVDHDVILCY